LYPPATTHGEFIVVGPGYSEPLLEARFAAVYELVAAP